MTVSDAASLQNLHDIVPAPPVPWWPPAPGWYVAGSVLAMALVWMGWRMLRRWHASAYRREALKELKALAGQLPDNENAMRKLPELVKRTALCSWSRERVAGLSGRAWLVFLDQTGNTSDFTDGAGKLLPDLAYAGAETLRSIPREQTEKLVRVIEHWVRTHGA